MNEIGDAFASALRQMLKQKKLTVKAAARELGISRQAFHSCLAGRLPRRKTLNRAVHKWDLKLDLGRYSFDKRDFPAESKKLDTSEMQQRSLWEILDSLQQDNLHVAVKRVGKALRVDVRIELPA